VGWGEMDWIVVSWDRDRWQAVVSFGNYMFT